MRPQRDILPLPSFPEFFVDRSRVSRSVACRHARRLKSVEWAHDAILAINELGGFGESASIHSQPGDACLRAVEHISGIFDSIGDPPDMQGFGTGSPS